MIAPPRPPQDDPELLIREARARRRRRHLLIAAAVATAAALGLSIHALAGSPGNRRATGGAAGAGVRPCRSPQLAVSALGGAGDGAGNAGASVEIVDTSSHWCALPAGLPAMSFILHGKTAPMHEQLMAPPYSQVGPRAGRILVPGRKVMYMADWSGECPGAAAAQDHGTATVALRFGNGLRVAAPEGTPENIPIVPGCAGLVPRPTVLVSPALLAPT
jgi:hypothetical protein